MGVTQELLERMNREGQIDVRVYETHLSKQGLDIEARHIGFNARDRRARDDRPWCGQARFLETTIAADGKPASLIHLIAAKGSDRKYVLTVGVPRTLRDEVDADAIFGAFSLD